LAHFRAGDFVLVPAVPAGPHAGVGAHAGARQEQDHEAKTVSTISPDDATAFLSDGYLPENGADVQRMSVAIYRLLAQGAPVSRAALAAHLAASPPEVADTLAGFPPSTIEWDESGRIVGFVGLGLTPTEHRFETGGHVLHTWCAFDAFFLPEILDASARLTTRCPATGVEIHVVLTSAGLAEATPPEPVMSMITPDAAACCDDLRGAFCRHVNLFRDSDAFSAWAQRGGDVGCVPLPEAVALARRRNAARYGDIAL